MWKIVTTVAAAMVLATLGASSWAAEAAAQPAKQTSGTSVSGPVDGVRFVVSWVQDADPAKAGATAYEQGVKEMGTPPKAIMFFERFGVEEGKTAVKALRAKAGDVPTIGTKSVPLVNGGTLQQNVMAILIIGGPKANVKITKTALDSDRSKTGVGMAAALKDVPDLKVVMALSEGDLSFEQGVNVEGFLHGVLDTLGPNVSLWGGNGSRVQYYNDEVLSRYVVALGLGGPISVVYSTSTEFQPVGEPVTVTKVSDVDPKLVLEFDGRPAPEVYRERRGMPATELFTRDSEHPVGVITSPGKVYVRQVFAAYPLDKESIERLRTNDPLTGKIPADTKGLRFIAPIPVSTKCYILKGGGSAERIYESAAQCMQEMIKAIPEGKKPMVALLSDCVTRNGRINRFTQNTGDEVLGGIIPGMGGLQFPILGFYAGGEIGHINGVYQGLPYQYQQHSFVPILIVQ